MITDEQREVVSKIEKLMKLASKAGTPAEAEAATAKVQELLTLYNLDMAQVEQGADADVKREQQKIQGGAYQWQRDLWRSVAELNFCLYFTSKEWSTRPGSKKFRYRSKHNLVGRMVNVKSTQIMCGYVQDAIDRLIRDRFPGNRYQYYGPDIMAYREGISDRVVERIYQKRSEMLAEEERKKHEAAARAREEGRAGVSTATGLTISTYKDAETDANMDFLHGEGWSAKQALARAQRAQKMKEAEEAYAQWAAANPEEAAKEEKKRQEEYDRASKQRRRSWSYKPSAKEQRSNSGMYYSGYDAGAAISLDPQLKKTKVAGLLA